MHHDEHNDQRPSWQRPPWQDGVIHVGAEQTLAGFWIRPLAWAGIGMAALWVLPETYQEQGLVALAILIFPGLALVGVARAYRRSREWRRFGITPVYLDPFPGIVGGDVGGRIRIPVPYRPGLYCETTLRCVHSYLSGTGGSQSRREKILWQERNPAKVSADPDGMILQFHFRPPQNLPPTQPPGKQYHLWRLDVAMSLRGGSDLQRSFELPVCQPANTPREGNSDSRYTG